MKKDIDSSFYSIDQTASVTECTGMMPAMPPSAEEQENLTDMLAIHCPPAAMEKDEAAAQWAHEAVRPSDERSSRKMRSAFRPSTAAAPNRPAQGHNRPSCGRSPAPER